MKPSKELKRLARENLAGNYRIAMGAQLITLLLPMIVEFPFSSLYTVNSTPTQITIYYIAEILISILTGVLTIGISQLHLNISRKKECSISQIFSCYRTQTDRYIIAYAIFFAINLFSSIPVAVASYLARKSTDTTTILVCIGLGVFAILAMLIISVVYSMLFYVLLDHPELTVLQCYKLARQLIRGKKGKFLYLILSFIGMEFLGLLSLGIGLLWVEPYREQTFVCFYRNASGELLNEYV